MGAVGMSYNDFCRLRPFEFKAIAEQYNKARDLEQRGAWERTRIIVCSYFQSKTRKRVDPKTAMPLPWDADARPKREAPQMSMEERMAWIEAHTKPKDNGIIDNKHQD